MYIAHSDPASIRTGFVFDINTLVEGDFGPSSATPRPGAQETLQQLQDHHVAFVIYDSRFGVLESDVAKTLNQIFSLKHKIKKDCIVTANSPLRNLVVKTPIVGVVANVEREWPVLVIGGDGSRARELAWEYGFEFVTTTAEVVKYFDEFAEFRAGEPEPESESEFPYIRYKGEKRWRMRSSKNVFFNDILVFSPPENPEQDTAIVKHLMENAGALGYKREGIARAEQLMGQDRVKAFTDLAPGLHVCTTRTEPEPFLGPALRPWIAGKMDLRWGELKPNVYGPLAASSRTLDYFEWALMQQNMRTWRSQIGNPAAEGPTPAIRTAYFVGCGFEGPRKASHRNIKCFGISAPGGVVAEGEEPSAQATHMQGANLAEVVQYLLDSEHTSAVQAGFRPMWPSSTPQEPPVKQRGGGGDGKSFPVLHFFQSLAAACFGCGVVREDWS